MLGIDIMQPQPLTNKEKNMKRDKIQVTEVKGTLIKTDRHIPTPEGIDSAFQAFYSLLGTRIESAGGIVIDKGHHGWYPPKGATMDFPISHDVALAIRDLHDMIKKEFIRYGDERYMQGVDEGRNLLLQLNKGDVTLEQFEKNIIKR